MMRKQTHDYNWIIISLMMLGLTSCCTRIINPRGNYQYTRPHVWVGLILQQDSTFEYTQYGTGLGAFFEGTWKQKGNTIKLKSERKQLDKHKESVKMIASPNQVPKVVIIDITDSTRVPAVNLFIDGEEFTSDENGEIYLDQPINGRFKLKFFSEFEQHFSFKSEVPHELIFYIGFRSVGKLLVPKLRTKRLRIQGDSLVSNRGEVFYKAD